MRALAESAGGGVGARKILGAAYEFGLRGWLKLVAWTYPVACIIDRRAQSVLDVACGRGMPMHNLRQWRPSLFSVGVDLFWPYLELCASQRLHNAYVAGDVRALPIQSRSFDVVLASQVIEHLSKPEGDALITELERIARYQVIIVTPDGYVDHELEDANPLQAHLSGWDRKDFECRGYVVMKQGLRRLCGQGGLVHRLPVGSWSRRAVWFLGAVLDPLLFSTQVCADDCLIATKTIERGGTVGVV